MSGEVTSELVYLMTTFFESRDYRVQEPEELAEDVVTAVTDSLKLMAYDNNTKVVERFERILEES